jgi:hypothetical protein
VGARRLRIPGLWVGDLAVSGFPAGIFRSSKAGRPSYLRSAKGRREMYYATVGDELQSLIEESDDDFQAVEDPRTTHRELRSR